MQYAQDSTLLRHLVLEVAELRRAIERMGPPRRRLNPADHAHALLLVPVLAAAVSDRDFTTAELVRMAQAQIPGAAELRRAIEAATGGIGSGSARRIGKLLRRLEGAEVAGLSIARIGEDSAGAVWSVRPARVFP